VAIEPLLQVHAVRPVGHSLSMNADCTEC